MNITYEELARLGVPCEAGLEFDSEMLDVMMARFRIVGLTPRGAEIVRLRWVDIVTVPRPPSRPATARCKPALVEVRSSTHAQGASKRASRVA